MNREFVEKFIYYRKELQLKVADLAKLIGLSTKYIYNIEKEANGKKGIKDQSKKNISLEKLRDIILVLSQKKVTSNMRAFLEDADIKTEGFFNGISPNPKELNLDILHYLSLASVNLESYSAHFQIIDDLSTSGTELSEFIKSHIGDKAISTIYHDYQVWTFSDVLSDGFNKSASAKLTAYNIINYKIKYVYFIPIDDDFQPEIAYKNVKKAVNELLSNVNEEIQAYWKNENWEEYLIYYGISKASFLCRFRLYNATGEVTGNYNLGGITRETMKLINMEKETAVEMRNKLISIQREIESKDPEKNELRKTIGLYGMRKIFTKQ